eukprot:gnl/Trimastix_PCT/2836.p1 GENE.gnl/Trimastix_PCT/2836~~gnl/Trimastix_PCT/2836.p1  ORF type:complete len:294 (+),score=38.92 gnl/Trimastix_PCT/2836:40-882(+)
MEWQLLSFPRDIIVLIFGFVPLEKLHKIPLINRQCRDIFRDDELWWRVAHQLRIARSEEGESWYDAVRLLTSTQFDDNTSAKQYLCYEENNHVVVHAEKSNSTTALLKRQFDRGIWRIDFVFEEIKQHSDFAVGCCELDWSIAGYMGNDSKSCDYNASGGCLYGSDRLALAGFAMNVSVKDQNEAYTQGDLVSVQVDVPNELVSFWKNRRLQRWGFRISPEGVRVGVCISQGGMRVRVLRAVAVESVANARVTCEADLNELAILHFNEPCEQKQGETTDE